MLRRCTIPFLILGLILPSLSASQPFENTAIVRTVELGGSLVHVTTTYAVKALEADSKVYTIALGPGEKQKTSWLEAKIKGQQRSLAVDDLGYDEGSKSFLLAVGLHKPLALNETVNLVLERVETHATHPWPERAGQADDQALKYKTDLFVISPYHTDIQRTKFRAPSPRIVSYTIPEDLDDFTQEKTVSTSGATITYGPYSNVPPSSSNDFLNKYQKSITIHYKYDNPVLEVTNLKRAAEISHWGANLNIQDEIRLHNAGPALRGHFSRLEHQSQSFFKRPAPHVLHAMVMHLPAGIRNTYFYDTIGNVSTSRLRSVPSVPRNKQANQYSVLELRPRYPLMGGWNYSFTLGWDSSLADSATWDAKTRKYIVEIPIMTLLPGAVVDEAEVQIILPEGAVDVAAYSPFPAVSNGSSIHTTYLDTIGRPALTFEYKQLTDKHAGSIYVSYSVPFAAHVKKPIAVAIAFLGIFTLCLVGRRVDLRIHKT